MENDFKGDNSIPDSAKTYERQSELNDMKQHADKIIQGIKKLEDKDAHRAIWELFQNAVDLSSECEIIISLTENTLQFSHNGQPFTPVTLDCLFKQVSSKTLEEKKIFFNENEPVGQYGTGFIATHVFGKEIIIDGALVKDGGHIPLDRFIIDRRTGNWREFGEQIRQLKRSVSNLLNNEASHGTTYPPTIFTYNTTTKYNRKCAEEAIESLRTILPYVMTLNPRLKKVTVKDFSKETINYQKIETINEGQLNYTSISVNNEIETIYFLKSPDDLLTVVLPFTNGICAEYLGESIPRLFLYYPLVGTQNFGINYLIHSRHFLPTEPRDGLYLSSENEDNQKEEEANQKLLNVASQMIFDFIKSKSSLIRNPLKLAKINFVIESENKILDKYFKTLKSKWINEFKSFSIVETTLGNLRPSETIFIHSSLLECDDAFNSIYELVNLFWKNTPLKQLIKEWTTIINEWELEDIKYVGITELVLKIQESESLNSIQYSEELQSFYNYLIDKGNGDYFNSYKLLPNLKGELRLLSGLNSNVNIPIELIEIADVIMPDITGRYIHPDFKFNLELHHYNRKTYSSDINTATASILMDNSISTDIPTGFLNALIKYCKITSSSNLSNIPMKMVDLICQYYNCDRELLIVPTIKGDELDIRSPQRKLIRIFLNDLSLKDSTWVLEKKDFLKNVIDTGSSYSEFEDMFKTLKIFPNQLYEMTIQSYLQIDEGIPDRIKDLYDRILKPSHIRATLVHDEFKEFLKKKEYKSIRSLTERIESEFFDSTKYASINEHTYKNEILQLIEEIKTKPEYAEYFPLLFSKKSSILVDLADGEDTFSILSLDSSKIKKLAELGKNPNLDQIVKLGQEALVQQQQENANFQHKYKIGRHIEKIMRDNISNVVASELKADVRDKQDGQDIVISVKDKPLFYIEVKSRWNVKSSVQMSKNQTLRASKEKSNYSLCTVDMTKYLGKINMKSLIF